MWRNQLQAGLVQAPARSPMHHPRVPQDQSEETAARAALWVYAAYRSALLMPWKQSLASPAASNLEMLPGGLEARFASRIIPYWLWIGLCSSRWKVGFDFPCIGWEI